MTYMLNLPVKHILVRIAAKADMVEIHSARPLG
jgi:hypothetical protein